MLVVAMLPAAGALQAASWRRVGAARVGAAAAPPCMSASSRRALLAGGVAAALLPSLPMPAAAAAGSMVGKTVVVTGANSGLGLATASDLAAAGASVVLAVRDPSKGEAAAAQIRAATPAGSVEVAQLELAELSSVRAFAKRWGDRPLDVLVLNAGVMAIPTRSLTKDGFERHWGVNHLGHFALTALLWPSLRRAASGSAGGARVVVVSSDSHKKAAGIAFDDVNLAAPGAYKDCATPFCSAYTQSKLANVLFAKELARRVPPGLDVAVSAVSPGLVNTALFRYALPDLHTDVGTGAVDDAAKLDKLYQVQGYFMTPAAKAAQTQLRLASDPALTRDAAGGKYFIDGKPAAVSPIADDAAVATRLWALSEAQTGIKFEP